MPGISRECCGPAEPGAGIKRRRIVLTTFGSLGDLHPYIAVALGLQARGHEAVIATSGYYRQKIEALGLGFRAVRPDHPDPETGADLMRRSMDRRTGSEFVIREYMMSALRETYEDTLAAADGADLLVSHLLTFTTRLVAEKKGIPWASTFLQPLGLFSVYDPPVFPQVLSMAKLRFLGPAFHRLLFWWANGGSAPGSRRGTVCGLTSACRPRRTSRCSRARTRRFRYWRCSRRYWLTSNRTGLSTLS